MFRHALDALRKANTPLTVRELNLCRACKATQKTRVQSGNRSLDHEQAKAGDVPGNVVPSLPCGARIGRRSIRGNLGRRIGGLALHRFRVPEIAIGFLLATALWAVLSIYQPEYAGPKSNSSSEGSQKHSDVLTPKDIDDRLARYTLWLVVFTAVLAASTILLWIETRRAGKRQSHDMEASVRVANRSAQAAEGAANAADLSAKAALRVEQPILTARDPGLISISGNVPKDRSY
jgi:hypothetical protein